MVAEVVVITLGGDGTGTPVASATSGAVDTTGATSVLLFGVHEGSPAASYSFTHNKSGGTLSTPVQQNNTAISDLTLVAALIVGPTVGAGHTFSFVPASNKPYIYCWGIALSGNITIASIEQAISAEGFTNGGLLDVDAGTLTPAGAAYLFQGAGFYNGGTATANTAEGWAIKGGGSSRCAQGLSAGSGGTYNPVMNYNAGADYCTIAFAIKETSGSYSITCDSGTYNLTGQDVSLKWTRLALAMGQGSYNLSGQTATLTYGSTARTLACDAGFYTLLGSNALIDLSMNMESGSYSLTGQTTNLVYSPINTYSLICSLGNYTLNGQVVDLKYNRQALAMNTGNYNLTGIPAGLIYSGAPVVSNGRRKGVGIGVGIPV